jgi:hypothetical protein
MTVQCENDGREMWTVKTGNQFHHICPKCRNTVVVRAVLENSTPDGVV